jgi:hypothetical protein
MIYLRLKNKKSIGTVKYKGEDIMEISGNAKKPLDEAELLAAQL